MVGTLIVMFDLFHLVFLSFFFLLAVFACCFLYLFTAIFTQFVVVFFFRNASRMEKQTKTYFIGRRKVQEENLETKLPQKLDWRKFIYALKDDENSMKNASEKNNRQRVVEIEKMKCEKKVKIHENSMNIRSKIL